MEVETKLAGYTIEQLRLLTDFVQSQVGFQRRQVARIRDMSGGSAVVPPMQKGRRG